MFDALAMDWATAMVAMLNSGRTSASQVGYIFSKTDEDVSSEGARQQAEEVDK